MGPDPGHYNPGSFPPYHHPPPPFQEDDVLMSDAESHSLHQPPYFASSSSSSHHFHTLYHNLDHHHHHHLFSYHHPALAILSSTPPSFTVYDDQPPNHFSWPTFEHEPDSLNDEEGSSLSAIHHALSAMSPQQNMSQSATYDTYGSDLQDELEATTPSTYISHFPHHQPLPQPGVQTHQPISLDAGSWPTMVPNPGPVPPILSPPGHSVNPTGTVSHQLQQIQNLQAAQDVDSDEEGPEAGDDELPSQASLHPQPSLIPTHLLDLSHSHPNSLGPENPQLLLFLRRWIHSPSVYPTPNLDEVNAQTAEPERVIHFENLDGDKCDMQGINWQAMGTSRRAARHQRDETYKNYVNRPNSDCWEPIYDFPSDADFFRFRRMDVKHRVHLAHFQLRNVLSCVSRSLAFYPYFQSVQQINPVSGKSAAVAGFTQVPGLQISTLSAKHGALVVGGFNGDYYIKSLDSIHEQQPGYHEGQLTINTSGITNHVQLYQDRRSDRVLASFASNDSGFRTLDVETDKIISETAFNFPINCTAISPDRRLRVMVGDHNDVLICNSETNEVLQKLRSHTDFGFACDWSENGWNVATGFQDMMVKIWDARKWTNSNGDAAPLTTMKTNIAGARSLRFSPLGSGKPVLVAAEEADFINIIDAESFARRQVVDIFGEIGGIDFVNDGRDLMVLACDRHRGGLLRLERTRQTLADGYDSDAEFGFPLREFERGIKRRNRTIYNRRRLRAACPASMDLF